MPACFQLCLNGEPISLAIVDNEVREFLGEKPNPHYFHRWYHLIGLAMACGKTYEEIEEAFGEDKELNNVIQFLKNKYTIKSWYQTH